MPSPRRVKVMMVMVGLILLSLLYLTGSARNSNQRFYDRTVAAMDRKEAAANVKAEADIAEHEIARKLKEAKEKDSTPEVEKDAAAEVRKPPQVAIGKENVPKPAKGGEKWATGKGEKEEEKNKKPEKTEEEKDVDLALNTILKRSPIIIFSKSYCPYSKKAKAIFAQYTITPSPFIVELDQHPLGPQIQSALEKTTGRRTVPNVLVSGSSIGGGDDVAALHEKGELVGKIKGLGGKRIMEIKMA